MLHHDDKSWAQRLVGTARLGDKRRNERAAQVALGFLANPGVSLAAAARGSEAAKERYYRHVRSASVCADELLKSACLATAADVVQDARGDVLLIADTTTLGYTHAVAKELGHTGRVENNAVRGWQVHTVLAVSADSGEIFGPVEQLWWSRNPDQYGHAKQRQKRPYEFKESYKWESGAQSACERLAAMDDRIVLVTDRESDVYEYLVHLVGQAQRFIIRCSWNRCVEGGVEHVFERLEARPVLAELQLEIAQKGGRSRRVAHLRLRTESMVLKPPHDVVSQQPPIMVNAVLLEEYSAPQGAEPVRWILFTSDPVEGVADAMKVARRYAKRWRIEEFHKVWKSEGMRVEHLRMATADNLRRAAVLQAFCAARLMRLRDALVPHRETLTRKQQDHNGDVNAEQEVQVKALANAPCDQILTTTQWKLLWTASEKTSPPQNIPSRRWASLALARLGSWTDTKSTGRPGYRAYFCGWQRLMERCSFYEELPLLGLQIAG